MIQRIIEQAGIATIGISIVRQYTEKIRPPRTIFLRWPFGHPLGEPGNRMQQQTVLREALRALYRIELPGTIVDLPYRWKRDTYTSQSLPELAGLQETTSTIRPNANRASEPGDPV